MNLLENISTIINKARIHFIGFPCSPILYPWFKIYEGDAPIIRFHRLIFSWRWKNKRKIMFIQAFLWPLKSFLLACKYVIKYGRIIIKEGGVSRTTQWAQMLYLANFYNISPHLYYQFKLFEADNFNKATLYLQNNSMEVILDVLRSTAYKNVNAKSINDKGLFFKQCKIYGLPVSSVVAIFYRHGQEEWFECELNELPSCDLFLKFTDSSCGLGSELWVYDAAAKLWRKDIQALDKAHFIGYCREKALKRPLMAQRRLANNKEIAPFSGGALSTFRVMTCLKSDGKASILSAGLRMSLGKMIVDNYSAGGIIAGIDLEKGKLRAAIGMSSPHFMDYHPDTHAKITGHQLACWKEIAELSIHAQECFRERLSIGWDIAMTEEGPTIIEGNTHYCFEVAQLCLRKPLGETILPSIYLEVLASTKDSPLHFDYGQANSGVI